ncbi:MAG TPA: S8/S53 family peptidase [Trichormus sp.]
MHISDHSNQRNRRLMTALSALVVACGLSTPAFSAPADNQTGFQAPAGQQTTSSGPALADDSLLVLVAPGSDTAKVQGFLSSEAHANTINNMHVDSANYSILQIQPQAGQRESTFNQINSMKKSHGEIVTVGRNYKAHRLTNFTPDDPDFSQQWPLRTMSWVQAYSRNVNGAYTFQKTPHITILADGLDPVNHEIGKHVNQYNALNPNITPFLDNPPHGSFATGGGEGDVDCSITGAMTNNGRFIAGTSSFGGDAAKHSHHADLIMLQMTTTDTVASANIYNAITWAINHQNKRGGPGPVNLSYGSDFPAAPLWSDPMIQSLATTLQSQGDILVVACGDTPGTYSSAHFPMGKCLVIQGTDRNTRFVTAALTQLSNDPLAAPGAIQPALIGGVYHDDFYGTSFSAPFYSSAIADCLAVNPNLTSLQAAHIVDSTGNPVQNAPYPARVPNFFNALFAAQNRF